MGFALQPLPGNVVAGEHPQRQVGGHPHELTILMTTTTSPLKRAIKAGKEAMRGQRYGFDGTPFACPFCGHDRFDLGLYLPLVMARPLTCRKCGHVGLFGNVPKVVKD